MADLYGTNARSPSLESEDMSSLLHNLLHSSSTSQPPSSAPFKEKHKQFFSSPAPTLAATSESTANLSSRFPIFFYSDCRFGEGTSTAGSSVIVDSSTGFNFSDPGLGFMADAEDCARNTFSSACAVDSDGITSTLKGEFTAEKDGDDLGFDSKKGNEVSEAPVNPVPSRSSKRSRAAEVHNLSEKRRRSRINEKMKALQNLIPNSNKTDKASMLDEAIEYLKHLQLQVQMLSMRNGLSLHPFCLPGSLPPAQLPQLAIGFDGGNELLNSKGGEDTFSGTQAILMRAAFELPNQCTLSSQPKFMSPVTNITNSETSLGLDPLIQNHYEPFNHLTTSKVNGHEDKSSQLQLDMSCSRKESSSGVPS